MEFNLADEIAKETAKYRASPETYAVEVWRSLSNGWVVDRAYDGEPNFAKLEDAEKRCAVLSIGRQARVVAFERASK